MNLDLEVTPENGGASSAPQKLRRFGTSPLDAPPESGEMPAMGTPRVTSSGQQSPSKLKPKSTKLTRHLSEPLFPRPWNGQRSTGAPDLLKRVGEGWWRCTPADGGREYYWHRQTDRR